MPLYGQFIETQLPDQPVDTQAKYTPKGIFLSAAADSPTPKPPAEMPKHR